MGLGRLARRLGTIGMVIEGVGYVVTAGVRIVRAIKGDPAESRDARQDRIGDSDVAVDGQQSD